MTHDYYDLIILKMRSFHVDHLLDFYIFPYFFKTEKHFSIYYFITVSTHSAEYLKSNFEEFRKKKQKKLENKMKMEL